MIVNKVHFPGLICICMLHNIGTMYNVQCIHVQRRSIKLSPFWLLSLVFTRPGIAFHPIRPLIKSESDLPEVGMLTDVYCISTA